MYQSTAYPEYPQQSAYAPQEYPPHQAPPPFFGAIRQQSPPPVYEAEPGGGGPHQPESEFAGTSFSEKSVRRMFIRKVYLILTAQLAVTVGFIALFVFVEPVKRFVQTHSYMYWISFAAFFILYIALVCCHSVRRNFPTNFICLGLFTLALSYMTGTISSYHDTQVVLMAAGITCAVCLAVTLFSLQTRCDFTRYSGALFVFSVVVIVFGIVAIFTYNRILDTVYAALIALLFTLFLAFDTQMIMGGRYIELSPEEYISGALQLYVDVVYIFWAILMLTGAARGGN